MSCGVCGNSFAGVDCGILAQRQSTLLLLFVCAPHFLSFSGLVRDLSDYTPIGRPCHVRALALSSYSIPLPSPVEITVLERMREQISSSETSGPQV